MTSLKLVAGAVALTLGLASAAMAQPGPGGPGGPDGPGRGGRGPGGPMMGGPLGGLLGLHPDLPLPALNLTDAQEEQVRTIMQGHRDAGRALMQRAQASMDALRTATAGTIDEGAAAQQGQALGAVIADAAVLRGRVRSEVWAILTPEQQAEATKIQAERQARQSQMRQRLQQRMDQKKKG
ncbi:Spy/CpxP family protein refolding chaperone [Luteitalea sp.]|uniref:Spy/CpxP family protein refolding chaperone n=1 Tax=Luteitalea sp. TaxID=2004800 RepID=UPI0037C53CE7